ncbi:MAG TPA: hypothetical protein VHK24_04730 [Steroidobacter sp.]|jgi:DNA topoisomerase IB|nr:hypothetical protein [Steroidobacter sp.]
MREMPPANISEALVQARRHARANGLRYVSDCEPGITRKRNGKGFCYFSPTKRLIASDSVLERIRQLAIPPAYTDVWVCSDPRGHLQATGRDARGRKQYRYHPRWRQTRDDGKFSRMVDFGDRLPQLRRRLKEDLALAGLPSNKVLAVVVTLLDELLLRVGNEEYARSNNSYGLTTLKNKHVRFLRDGRASFCFRGKSGRKQQIILDDKRLVRLIRRMQQLPGQQLFQYVDDDGELQPIDSGMVNDYLRDATGSDGFTAKDFRTWGATVRAIAHLACRPHSESLSKTAFKRCVADTARRVADALGNTPAVCRKSYINPVVFSAWRCGVLDKMIPKTSLSPKRMEQRALKVLRSGQAANGERTAGAFRADAWKLSPGSRA